MNVIIGTRGSKLALAQAEYVKNRLQKHYPQNSYELKIISTKGDREQKKALDTPCGLYLTLKGVLKI